MQISINISQGQWVKIMANNAASVRTRFVPLWDIQMDLYKGLHCYQLQDAPLHFYYTMATKRFDRCQMSIYPYVPSLYDIDHCATQRFRRIFYNNSIENNINFLTVVIVIYMYHLYIITALWIFEK